LVDLWQGTKDADIVHVFSASYWSFLLSPAVAYAVAGMRKKKILINYHSGEAQDHLRRSRLARWILRRAAAVVVPSGYLVDVFRQFGIEAKAVPNIVNLDQFSYKRREEFAPNFVCTRGFHPYYGIDDVLRAFAEIQRNCSAAQLCLVGAGETETEMRRLAMELRLRNVEFAGIVSRGEIGQYYRRADFFLNASVVDNMPVSILEAFASGTPVITTAAGGIPYIVEHKRTGLLSAPTDWKALAENALRLLRERELAQRISANAYQESKRYRWENVRPQWLEAYRSLLRIPSPSALRADLPEEYPPSDRI
jgi:glycosyltransferase involved in cell wall biosynthesis